MAAQPTISVITPSYNQGKFLEANLESVRTQNYDSIEHIVIDGGSTDQTVDILKEYEYTYNLKWVSEEDRGQSHAVNKGIQMATGDWIGWQNSDDYYLPGSFNSVVTTASQNPAAEVIYGDVLVVDEVGNEVDRIFNTQPSAFVQRYWSLFTNNQTTFFKPSVFDQVGLLSEDLRLTMDAELFWRLLQNDLNMHHIPEFLGAFRQQSNAKTHNQSVDTIREELSELYNSVWYDDYIPKTILRNLAKGLKIWHLIGENRWYAFLYNIKKLIT